MSRTSSPVPTMHTRATTSVHESGHLASSSSSPSTFARLAASSALARPVNTPRKDSLRRPTRRARSQSFSQPGSFVVTLNHSRSLSSAIGAQAWLQGLRMTLSPAPSSNSMSTYMSSSSIADVKWVTSTPSSSLSPSRSSSLNALAPCYVSSDFHNSACDSLHYESTTSDHRQRQKTRKGALPLELRRARAKALGAIAIDGKVPVDAFHRVVSQFSLSRLPSSSSVHTIQAASHDTTLKPTATRSHSYTESVRDHQELADHLRLTVESRYARQRANCTPATTAIITPLVDNSLKQALPYPTPKFDTDALVAVLKRVTSGGHSNSEPSIATSLMLPTTTGSVTKKPSVNVIPKRIIKTVTITISIEVSSRSNQSPRTQTVFGSLPPLSLIALQKKTDPTIQQMSNLKVEPVEEHFRGKETVSLYESVLSRRYNDLPLQRRRY